MSSFEEYGAFKLSFSLNGNWFTFTGGNSCHNWFYPPSDNGSTLKESLVITDFSSRLTTGLTESFIITGFTSFLTTGLKEPLIIIDFTSLLTTALLWSLKESFVIQSTPVISNSKGLSEILRDIRTSTYQICRTEEKLIRLTTFNKYMCNWTLEVRDILKILWKKGEIAP